MNPRSDVRAYATQARTLLAEHKVAAIFGCWTSASRTEVLPIVEELNGLLFYPSQYEGEEESPNIFYTGATPQQQALPAVDYLIRQGRKRFFVLGTDTVYPRTTNAILKSYLHAQGVEGDAIAEFYTPFNQQNWEGIVEWVRRFAGSGHAAIVTTVSGDANIYLYRELGRHHRRAHPGHDAGCAECRDRGSDGGDLDRLQSVEGGRRARRHRRRARGAPHSRRPPHQGAERLRSGDGSHQSSSAQAGGNRPHHRGRAHRADLDERWADSARALEPLVDRDEHVRNGKTRETRELALAG